LAYVFANDIANKLTHYAVTFCSLKLLVVSEVCDLHCAEELCQS